jgi:hypothetical protein
MQRSPSPSARASCIAFTIDGGVVPPASTQLPGVNQTGVAAGMRHTI